MTDIGLLVVAADGAHPGWGIAGNALGALIGGLIAALIAWRVSVHETQKQKEQQRKDREASAELEAADRRDQLARVTAQNLLAPVSSLVRDYSPGPAGEVAEHVVWGQSRQVQMKAMLHEEGRADLITWLDGDLSNALNRVSQSLYRNRFTEQMELHGPSIPKMWKTRNDLMMVEFVLARWSTQPLNLWTTELPPAEVVSALPTKETSDNVQGDEGV